MINPIGRFLFNIILCSLFLTDVAFAKDCFRVGDYWHDLILPNEMKSVRWLFGDDETHYPFMSVSFNLEDSLFDDWAKECGVVLRKSGKRKFWDKDIDGGGFVSVMIYENNRYCIGIMRTPLPEQKRTVNGKDYFACPLDSLIDY